MLSLVFAPVTFYQTRLRRPASWRLALGGPLGCGALAIVSHGIFSTKIAGPLYDSLAAVGVSTAFATSMQYMGVLNVAFVYVLVWLSASAFMIAFDVLVRQSLEAAAHPRDQCAGVLFTAALAGRAHRAVAVLFEPPADRGCPAGPSRLRRFERFKRLLQQDRGSDRGAAVNACFAAWLYGLFGAGYHAACRVLPAGESWR